MRGAAKKAMAPKEQTVLIAMPASASPQRLAQEVELIAGKGSVCIVASPASLREIMPQVRPQVILLDDRILEAGRLAESVREFSSHAATILVAPYERVPEVARLVADGDVEFVPRSTEWTGLATDLIERRLRWAEAGRNLPGLALEQNIGELFRHEINNPLTGILGNAELILAHSDRLPAIDTQRIRTVVELAVRLRETVRRVSDAWEPRTDSAKSA